MARYIDVDKAIHHLIGKCGLEYSRAVSCGIIISANAIDKLPTADVEEVRHGEWIKVQEGYPRYVCTRCRHLYNNTGYKYCPNCGAKMDGGKE